MNAFGKGASRASAILFILLFVTGLALGGIVVGYIAYSQFNHLEDEISTLKDYISNLTGNQNITNQNITIYYGNTSLIELYDKVRDSVVLIHGTMSAAAVQGSGFVCKFQETMVIVTNNHVVDGTNSISVTFSNGNGYAATKRGSDPYADLAVLTIDAPMDEFKPLEIVSSSTLRVGESVIAIGNPYGLIGSMTTGVVSALGRTITEENFTKGFAIANIIQTSAPINPGNSGGPLLNYDGKVVGITTAIVEQSQGVGFAVPSNTIIREIWSLIQDGSYESHSYLGLRGLDMSYERAQNVGADVTYGWLIDSVIAGGPAENTDILRNDIIIGINGTRIRSGDEMSSYLEERTFPGQVAVLNIARGNQRLDILVTLGKRPALGS